ncbi:MAG: tRNA 2-thiouridine synthesizing protein D [Candidatus Azotimanducaceae bacterium]|jgi:tRNA 2-thiouridine synthesizing protein D
MKFSIAIFGGPSDSQASLSALNFARAIIKNGHELYRVFFYQEAVTCGNALVVAPQDENNLNTSWGDFSDEHNVELILCIASALRRGILNQSEAERYEKDAGNLHPSFTISGLGQLIDAGIESDRLISFGK